MISFWRDLPSSAWPIIIGYWVRTAALALVAVAVGAIIDARGSGWWWTAVAALVVAAATVWFAEVRTARIHVTEESRLRRAALIGWWAGAGRPGAPTPEGPRTGGTVALLTESAAGAANYRAEFLGPTFAALSAPLIVVAVIASTLDPWLGLVLAVLVLAVPAVTIAFGTVFRSSSGQYRRISATVAGGFQEVLRCLGLLRLLGATRHGRQVLEEGADLLAGTMFRMLRKDQLMIIVNDLLFSAGLVTVMLAWLWHDHSAGTLSVGEVTAGVLLAVQLYEPIDSLGRTFYVGRGGRPLLERLNELATVTPNSPGRVDDGPGELELRGVTIRRGEHLVVEDLDLTVPAGTMLGVVGPTGAGKTSLALVLQGLLPVTGQVLLDGRPTTKEDLLQAVTTLTQRPHVFAGTVADNLRLGASDATDAELRGVLQRVRLLAELPDGLETRLGEGGHGLSGGQIRRLGLARALMSRPRVLILDEPTADLDRHNSTVLGEVIAGLLPTTTVVQIAHRLATLHGADQVLVMDEPPRVATVAELMADEGYFRTATRLEQA